MTKNIHLTISERHRENTENVRITGHTENGEAYTFHIKGENAWWFESFLTEGTQITLTRVETYIVKRLYRLLSQAHP
ncbi:MAG: hypothetical protein V6Z82_04285 [Flavobacteriales bacterium]